LVSGGEGRPVVIVADAIGERAQELVQVEVGDVRDYRFPITHGVLRPAVS
jgi:hypothetical protein